MTFYYTYAINGRERSTGSDLRGVTRKYQSIKSFMRYFGNDYIDELYAVCARENIAGSAIVEMLLYKDDELVYRKEL
jgi:hypothetical protein